jgi:predicted pyridoxine 5'-phosphate oxidase superfamily flavin-nucleotide-binding protein
MTMSHPSDVAFTPSVKAVQERKGSRPAYARIEQRGGWQSRITPDLAQFIAAQTSVFLATANADGQPYIQHRGGPPGFLRVVDEKTIAFADFAGNRQYITQGNLADNPKVHLFLIDYAHRQRVKIWGEARVVEGDSALVTQLMPEGYRRGRAGDHADRDGLGRQLPTAYPAALRGRRRGSRAGGT